MFTLEMFVKCIVKFIVDSCLNVCVTLKFCIQVEVENVDPAMTVGDLCGDNKRSKFHLFSVASCQVAYIFS